MPHINVACAATKPPSASTEGRHDQLLQLHAAQIPDALLTIKTVSVVSSLSAATIYRRVASDPTFPKLVRIGARCTRIRAGDLTAWLNAQAAQATAG